MYVLYVKGRSYYYHFLAPAAVAFIKEAKFKRGEAAFDANDVPITLITLDNVMQAVSESGVIRKGEDVILFKPVFEDEEYNHNAESVCNSNKERLVRILVEESLYD